MTSRQPSSRILPVVLLLLAATAARLDAAAQGPRWLAGFPLRAGSSIILMWTPIPGATGYRLFRQSGDEPFREIYSGPANTFNDMTPSPSETVTYKVAGIVKGASSDFSAPGTVRGVERMKAPAFTGAIGSTSAITLRWSSPIGAMFSNIYRAESEDGEYVLQESVSGETFSDRKPEPGKTYFYRIASVGKDGKESPRSAPIRASLKAKGAAGEAGAEKPNIRRLEAKGSFRGEELYELNQPSYTGFTGDGDLYVLERRGIQFFDRDGHFKRRIVFDKSWGLPGGLTVERDGDFLVPFYAEELLRRIAPDGKPVGVLRYPPYLDRKSLRKKPVDRSGEGEADDEAETVLRAPRFRNNPNQVAIDRGGFNWIVDGVRAQAIKVNGKGEEIAVIGRPPGTFDERGLLPTDLPTARGIQYNPYDGKLYVVLGVTAQIKVIDPAKATVLATFGGLGNGNSKFQGIGGLAFRKNGNILVLDHLMQAIKEFNPKYEYVATYVDVVDRDTLKLSSNLLSNFAFDEANQRFYVSSTLGNRVYMFDILPPKPPEAPAPPPKQIPKTSWK